MKKIYFIFIIVIALGTSSCKENFDPQIYGSLSTNDFPKTEKEFEVYGASIYRSLNSKWGYSGKGFWQTGFYGTDNGIIQSNDLASDIFRKIYHWGNWSTYSTGDFTGLKNLGKNNPFEKVREISYLTQVIDVVTKSSLSESLKKKYISEARMARGVVMYYLLWYYGPVPFINDPALIGTDAESKLARPERDYYVAEVAKDFRAAADGLEKSPAEYGRFTKGGALTFLMRLYLNEKDWTNTIKVAEEIQTLGYSLVDEYASLFEEETEVNSETIWAVSCNNMDDYNFNFLPWYCIPPDFQSESLDNGWGDDSRLDATFMITWDFYDTFEANDARRDLLITEYESKKDDVGLRTRTSETKPLSGAVIKKYPDRGSNRNRSQGNDVVICRYSEVLLSLAEALAEKATAPTDKAIQLVNQVRTRAGLADLSADATSSLQNFRDALLLERGHEFYLEGLRRIDLIRMNKWESAMKAAGKTPGPALFPIPEYILINANGQLKQTDGY